ncbi:MAG: hypothetical protein JXR68_03115, partial [Bacteroidales bacterium]|nr:hypothetical protein [Bacteroidales bacterium]
LSNIVSYSQNNKNYEFSQGKEVTDFIAPYLKDLCYEENFKFDSLTILLLEDTLRTEKHFSIYPFYLSSLKYNTGMWTYYTTKTPMIYEIEKYDTGQYIVLYNKLNPSIILLSQKSEWRVALIDTNYNIVLDKSFFTSMNYKNNFAGMWDMIYTSLNVINEEIKVQITYVHTGGGGGRDQEFTAIFKLSDIEIKVIQTQDDMDK